MARGTGRAWPAWRLLAVYYSGSFSFGLTSVGDFLIPLRARELGASLDQIGLIVAAASLLPAVFSVTAGEIADRWGARRTLLTSALVYGLGSLAMAAAPDYRLLIPLQIASGFARSAGWVASQTYTANMGEPRERADHLSRLSFFANGSMIVYPLLFGPLASLAGYQVSLAAMGLLSLLYAAIAFSLPTVLAERTTPPQRSTGGFGVAVGLTRQPGIQVVLLLTFVRLWNSYGWRPFIPLYLRGLGHDDILVGSVLAASAGVSTVTTLGAAWLARRSSNEVATAATLGLGTVGTAIAPWMTSVPAVYVPGVLIGTGVGVSLPLLMATVSREVAPDQRGVALGLRTGMNSAASMLAPVAVGAIAAPFGLPAGMLASAGVSGVLLAAAVARHAGNVASARGRPRPSQPPR